MAHKVTLIPGDGIGPEVTGATVRILEASGVKFEWETFQAGAEAFAVRIPSADGGEKQGLDDYLLAVGAEGLKNLLAEAKPVEKPE